MNGGAVADHRARVGDTPQAGMVDSDLETCASEQLGIVMSTRLVAVRRLVIGKVARFPDPGAHLYRSGPGASLEGLEAAMTHFADRGVLAVADPAEAGDLFNRVVTGGAVARAMHPGDAGLLSAAWSANHSRECTRVFLAARETVPESAG